MPQGWPSSVGAACFCIPEDLSLKSVETSTVHAAPTELGRTFGTVVAIDMALLAELGGHRATEDACKVRRPRAQQS
jgi:hypothetical protein